MKRSFFLLLCLVVSTAFAQTPGIIPAPVSLTYNQGEFALSRDVIIGSTSNTAEVTLVIRYFTEALQPALGYALATGSNPSIRFELNKTRKPVLGMEGYELDITSTGILLQANSAAGLFYGVQSILQLLPPAIASHTALPEHRWVLPAIHITDYPRFPWRGIMLDVSRHFFPKSYVKAFIDQIARYKFNRFHWSLTNDEGWRIEIKSYPRLTEVGAWRVPRDGAYGDARPPQPGEKATDGGYYTQDDIREVVQYARERFIEIIPEIDVPGHSMAAVASYPELSVTKDATIKVNPGANFATWPPEGGFIMHIDNTLNPTDEKVYSFLDKVFGEVASLFPYEYIHAGGDECYKGYWERDPSVQAFMKKNNIKDGHELQSYFTKRVSAIITGKKKKMIGWDEILEGGQLAPGAAVMSWRGTKGGVEAASKKHPVVMSPAPIYYLDMMQGDPAVEARVYNKARLKDVYAFDILAGGIDSTFVLGGQGNLWTEQIVTPGKAEYMMYPRAWAIAETMWTPAKRKDFNSFVPRVEQHFMRNDAAGINYASSLYDPVIRISMTEGKPVVTLTGELDGLTFYYTLDNSVPDKYATPYGKPVELSPEVKQFRVQSYRNGKPLGRLITLSREEVERRARH
ncbi:MAG: family 20 glycosylhydrolase [Cyclobacteriaceae bacterium]|jgi:hexosaminidase|nr:beta-N-acetylhexosaminidase [Cytophagales bacterium]HNP78412.1 family 20 glycosylhydrolase [Cyclobacteriaceae bacterium]